jgi:hypothetical protein
MENDCFLRTLKFEMNKESLVLSHMATSKVKVNYKALFAKLHFKMEV